MRLFSDFKNKTQKIYSFFRPLQHFEFSYQQTLQKRNQVMETLRLLKW